MYPFGRNREPFFPRRHIPLGAEFGRQRPLRRTAFSHSPGRRRSVLSALADRYDWDRIYEYEAPRYPFSRRPWNSSRGFNSPFQQTNHDHEFRRPIIQRRDSSPFEAESIPFSHHHHSHEHHHHPRPFHVHDDERYTYPPAGSHLRIPVMFLSQPHSRFRGGRQGHDQATRFHVLVPMLATINDLYDNITEGRDLDIFVVVENNELIPLEQFRTVGDLENLALSLVVVDRDMCD